MNLLHLLAALLLITTLAFTPRAQAVSSSKPIIDGLSGGTYKPLTTPALTGNNFVATGRVLVNGKWVNIPGYVPPASTAAQAARTSLWLNPWLIGASLLAWSGDAGLGADQFNGWTYTDPSGGQPPQVIGAGETHLMYYAGTLSSSTVLFSTPEAICALYLGPFPAYESCVVDSGSLKLHQEGMSPSYFSYVPIKTTNSACPQAYRYSEDSCQLVNPLYAEPVDSARPATQEDFEALPAPPVQALAELAPQVGVPVDDPVYEPIDVDIGTPYTKPDGSTAQQRAKISPAGNGEVWIDTYEQPVTDSQGNPVPNAPPVDTPEQPAEQPTQCDKYPDTLGCARLGSIPDETLPTENRSIALIQPVDIGNAGQCPAPMTATVAGMTIEWSFDPLCQYANALRPLVLALAWLSAGVIFIGGVRNG